MKRLKSLAVCLAALSISLLSRGQEFSFENHIFSQDALSVQAFAQDARGMMWIGTSNGLFSYDGYDFRSCELSTERSRVSINCLHILDDKILLLGTPDGILTFDLESHKELKSFINIGEEVLSIFEDQRGTIWVGTAQGLYRAGPSDSLPVLMPLGDNPEREIPAIYSIDEMDSVLYLGTYWGFCRYDISSTVSEYIYPQRSPWAVSSYSVLADKENNRVWFGSRRHLCCYAPLTATTTVEQENLFTIKTMYLQNDGTLVIGSEGAMYSYSAGQLNMIRHDSRIQNSLANNDVNVFFEDFGGNLWVGTGLGISLMPTDRRSVTVSTYYLTNQPEGNKITHLLSDSQSRFWLGGPNGLIFIEPPFNAGNFLSRWYSEDGRQWSLPHNNVRDIFEDSFKNIWILTDSGLNRFDETSGRILRYYVRGEDASILSGLFNDVCEGMDGSLWLFSTQEGVLKLTRESLDNVPRGGIVLSAKVYDESAGLPSANMVEGTVDRLGKVWTLGSKGEISIIDPVTDDVEIMDVQDVAVSRILQDTDGNIWAAYRGGVLQIGPVSRDVRRTVIIHENQDPLDIVQANDEIWTLYPDGIACLDRINSSARRFMQTPELGYGLFYTQRWNAVLIGRNDGVTLYFQGTSFGNSDGKAVEITDIVIDGVSNPTFDGHPLWACDKIVIDHNQHDISLKVSDFMYTKESKDIFAWRVVNKKDDWHFLEKATNVVSLGSLKRGRYDIELGYVGDDGEVAPATRHVLLVKKASWWASTPLICLYWLLAAALILFFMGYQRMKARLKIEQMEREQAQRQAETKVNFITEISHEFKTPLSLILAPLSELMRHTDPSDERYKSLDIINNNALKLSSLVHQVITFYRDGNDAEVELVQSHVDLVPFAQKVFLSHAEGLKSRAITFNFNSSHSSLYSFVDVVKLESALNNLLSNAAKFTPDGGEIDMTIDLDKEKKNILICVEDTGCGIPPEEQQYIFQRFYQAAGGKSQGGGTGLGLYMARNFVEMQGGVLEVESDGKHGSKFTIKLPVPQRQETAIPTTRKVQAKDVDDRPVLLIVEDNLDLSDFISHIFNTDYRCLVAHDGSEGYKSAVENTPDLVITDIMMPVMDGFEMCRKLKGNVRTATIPVIMLTAKDDRDTELESIKMKIEAFIPKPFDVSILQSRVHQLISLKRNIEQKVKYEYISTPKEQQAFSQSEKFLSTVTDIIEENLSDPEFNVNVLSEKTGMTQKFLYRKITKLTGMTTVEYIRTIRLKKAAMLLSDNKFAVSEVMYMVGFSNQSYFSKCFSQYFGVTPQQYKSGLRGEKVQS